MQNAHGQPTTERKLNIHQISPVACLRSLIGLVLFAVDLSELFAFDRLLVDFVSRVRVCIILSYPLFFGQKSSLILDTANADVHSALFGPIFLDFGPRVLLGSILNAVLI